MADPITLTLSAVKVAAAIGTFLEKRESRKLLQGQLNAGSQQYRRDVLLVAGNLGKCILPLGIVNTSALSPARDAVRNVFRAQDSSFLAIFDDELEEPLQYAVTIAMFLCAACQPVKIIKGFGEGILNWGGVSQFSLRQPVWVVFESCLSQLQINSRDINLLTRVPQGITGTVACHADKTRTKAISWLRDVFSEAKKRGLPQPKDASFTTTEVIILLCSRDIGPMFENIWGSDKSSLYYVVQPQDPGKCLYAYLVAGQLQLRPGQMLLPISRVEHSLLSWLEGCNGMAFKLLPDEALDDKHPKFKKNNRWLTEFPTVSINLVAVPSQAPVHVKIEAQEPPRRRAAPLRMVEAKYDFTAQAGNEISLRKGEMLEVLKEATDDGWLAVRKGAEEGDVPQSFVKGL